jgi:hypothetical protein
MEEVEEEKEELPLLQHLNPLINLAQCLTLHLVQLEQYVEKALQNQFPNQLRNLEIQHLVHDPIKLWKP